MENKLLNNKTKRKNNTGSNKDFSFIDEENSNFFLSGKGCN